MGHIRLIEGAQETAKNLLSESIRFFDSLADTVKSAEVQTELALCYERQGALDEARVLFQEALAKLHDDDGDLKAVALLRSAVLESIANRLIDALMILRSAEALFDASLNHTLKGCFHNEFATVLKNLALVENRTDYVDRALIEYTAASFHFETAGHSRYQACVENNLAMLFLRLNRCSESHEHLDRAQALLTQLKDNVHLAQVEETRARVMLAEGEVVRAAKSAKLAVRTLEKGDESSLLAEALTTYGIALSRLKDEHHAREAFERAIQVAEQAGDFESAALAALALVEEIPEQLSDEELFAILKSADDRLENTQNAALLRRQKNCFRRFASRVVCPDWPIALEESVHRHEAKLILRALEDKDGVIKRAAGLLELSRQRLQKILNNRHKDLREKIPIIKARVREKSLSKEDVGSAVGKNKGGETRAVKILHVEDNETVAAMVKEMLEDQGWHVETCADGNAALERISGKDDYDLLLVDYDLPGVNGLELINHARELDHRCDTPMVVLAASPVGAAAREEGADVFLQKPQDIGSLVETITLLLDEREQES
jgi:CheY-like chemotaxis protein